MLKRLVEDLDGLTSEFECNKKTKLTKQFFNSSSSLSSILDTILNFISSPTTQLNFLSSCKQLYEANHFLPKKNYLHNIHQHYSTIINDQDDDKDSILYRLDGFLRNLYIMNGVEFEDNMMAHDNEETLARINCYLLNAHNYYFKSGLVEVLGFYCEGHSPNNTDNKKKKKNLTSIPSIPSIKVASGVEYITNSSIHVKFLTHSGESVVLHQNLHITNACVGHYYLARELADSSLQTLVKITKEREFDIPAFESLLFSLKGNIQMEVLFRIMLAIGGVTSVDYYLKFILNTYNYVKEPPPPSNNEGKTKTQKKNQKQICYFGEKKYTQQIDVNDYRQCPVSYQLDSLIDLLKTGDDSRHTESMTKYVIELVYKSMASFASFPEKGNKYYIPGIASQFISGKCFLKDEEYKFIVTLRKTNGGKFKLLLFFPENIDEDYEVYAYKHFRMLLLDTSENIFLKECYSNYEGEIQKRLDQLYGEILDEDLCFESICECIIGLVYSQGYLVNYMKPGKKVWRNVKKLLPKKRKTQSAQIEAGQIGDDGLDLDPLTIFWIDEELTTTFYYGDVKTIKNPKIQDEPFEYVSKLIANYRAINRNDIEYETYGAYKDAHALYAEPIVDVHDFNYKEMSLYYVHGRHHYCAIVCGYDEIIICGEASEEIFYWTPYGFFRVGEPEETCDDDTNYDYSHLKPLKKLQNVTFDNVLANIEEFFAQFK